jgi:hypothetical protein
MTEKSELTKAELIEEINKNWTALQAVLDGLSPEEMTTKKDAAGWAIKDHLMHIAAWERSANFLLEGRPRHTALNVDKELYLDDLEDAINDAIFKQVAALPAEKALARLRDVHAETMDLLKPLKEADLHLPYSAYLPDEVGEGEGPEVIKVIYGNTAEHYAEHLGWIEALILQPE